MSVLKKLEELFEEPELQSLMADGYFDPKNVTHRMADVYLYLDGIAGKNVQKQDRAEAYRLLRDFVDVYGTRDLKELRAKAASLREYLRTQYPGAKDPPDVQKLKGTIREWEAELLWAYFGIEASAIRPLRLGFYTGDIFSQEPEINRDILPIYDYIAEVKPDIVTVAFDPEGSGPDTHYKALQAVAGALKMYEEKHSASKVRVWGYRNVWYRFTPAEANLMVPVSLNSVSMLHTAFMNCFGSQRAASFPSYDHDGPFSELAQKIQVEQYQMVKTCLGNDYFLKNNHPRLRAARGMIYLMEMSLEEFYHKVRELKKRTEAEGVTVSLLHEK
jgi:glucosamine-6-phosphate deaminase